MFDKPNDPNAKPAADKAVEGETKPKERVDYGDSAMSAGKVKPVTPDTPKDTGMPGEGVNIYELKAPMTQSKIFMGIMAVIVLVLVIGGGWWTYSSFKSSGPVNETPVITKIPVEIPDEKDEEKDDSESLLIIEDAPVIPTTTEQDIPEEKFAVPALDSDGDGLTDAEELQNGTDALSADTDNDGLNDRLEIQVWGTDPLNPDTDGDTYEDGTEVNGGYNPKGAGKLLQVPTN